MRESSQRIRGSLRALLIALSVAFCAGCGAPEERASTSTASSRIGDDGGAAPSLDDGGLSPSAREIVAQALAARPGPAMTALKAADEATLRRFGEAARATSLTSRARAGLADGPEVIHDEHAERAHRAVALDGDQALALARLNTLAAGTLRARWDDALGGPSSLERLWFVRRGVSERAVVEAFLDEHFTDVQALWKPGSRAELVVSGVRPLDEATTVVDLERRVDGIPVQGEWFEAHVTNDDSRFGRGVLTHFGGSALARPALASAVARERWLSAEAAARAAGLTGRMMGQRLVYVRGSSSLRPVWVLQDASGREGTVDAITGALLGEHDARGFIGPTYIQGWPPGATSVQSIVLRGANVTDAADASVGSMNWTDGTHPFTSADLRVQLAGPVGSSNPAAIGRVYRTNTGGTLALPLPLAWDAGTSPSANFGSPVDGWAPNSGTTPFPHTTEIVYGWLSYWQFFVGQKVGLQVPDRLEFRIDPWIEHQTPVSIGFFAGTSATADRAQPDENGAMTAGLIYLGSGTGDDVRLAEFASGGDGDEIFTTGHEFGHNVAKCAAAPGGSCWDVAPETLSNDQRVMYAPGDWRPAVWDGHSETNATFVSNVLNQFRYRPPRTGAGFDPNWNYVSYDATNDSFGSATQSNAGIVNCLDATSPPCPTGFQCVPSNAHRLSAPSPTTPTAGWCEPISITWSDPMGTPTDLRDDVVASTVPCPQGLFPAPRGFNGTSVMMQVCWHDAYANKFHDTVGSRLVATVGWRQGLLTTFNAVSGQSGNPKRDLVLGADSYRQRYTAGSINRYEAMRAVRSVYRGTGFVVNDDFPDVLPHGPILPVRGQSWVKVWWGNGLWDYPNSEDMLDVDAVLVRGVAGQSLEIQTSGVSAAIAPAIDVWRVDAAPVWVQSSVTGSLVTGPLPATAWYMIAFIPQAIGAWQAQVRHGGTDDFGASLDDAYPLAHGTSLAATATTGDTDVFAFDAPASAMGSNLSLTINAPFASSVEVWERVGTAWSFVGTHVIATGLSTTTVVTGVSASRLAFVLTASGSGSYLIQANLSCATGGSPCDVSQAATRTVVPAWGDRFAGRLDGATTVHEFTIDLAERDHVSVSVTDNDGACRPRIEVLTPPIQRHFLDVAGAVQPVLVWDDGAPVNNLSADTVGAGGHFEAATDGTYRVRVRPQPGTSCPWYRMHIARVYPSADVRPSW